MSGMFHLRASSLVAALAAVGLGIAARHVWAIPLVAQKPALLPSAIHEATFWGKPYPYGYSTPSAPRWGCYATSRFDTFLSHHYERIWICGNAVRQRY